MAITNFKPEIWSAELLVALEKSLVYAAPGVVNRDYEGEISQKGDTVHITGLAEPTIGDYTGADITVEDVDDSEAATLVVDQAKYFAFSVDDVEARQAAGAVMPEQVRKAGYRLRDTADQYVAGLMATAARAEADFTDTITLSATGDAYDLLVDLSVKLDDKNVPEAGRFVIVTPAFHGVLLRDERFVGDAAPPEARVNGKVGEAAGFTVRKSNNVPTGLDDDAGGPDVAGGKTIIAGSVIATTYAEQIAKTEAARMEKRFADLVKGLHVYGSEVVRPAALVGADVLITV